MGICLKVHVVWCNAQTEAGKILAAFTVTLYVKWVNARDYKNRRWWFTEVELLIGDFYGTRKALRHVILLLLLMVKALSHTHTHTQTHTHSWKYLIFSGLVMKINIPKPNFNPATVPQTAHQTVSFSTSSSIFLTSNFINHSMLRFFRASQLEDC